MKSPWKFLVELASGRRTAEGSRTIPEIDAAGTVDPPSSTPVPEPTLSVTPDDDTGPVTAGLPDAGGLDIANGDSPVVQPGAEGAFPPSDERTTIDDHALLNTRAHPSKPRSRPRKARARTALPTNVVSEGVKHGHENSSNAQSAPSFLDEVFELNEEIDRLRHQLADKLVLQNAQLEKMLKRFDAS